MTADPLDLFDQWLGEARSTEPNDAEAMALATCDADGRIGCRMVLLKGHGPAGFDFYTNEQSDKGAQLAERPRAALLFHWKSLRRQVRVEGAVERISDAEADAYFASRGRESQLGAWAIGINGFASVVGSTAAVPMAMLVGLRALLLLGALLYALAAVMFPRRAP